MDLVRELPYWPAAMALLIEAGQMTASDYVPTYPNLSLAFEGASTDALRSACELKAANKGSKLLSYKRVVSGSRRQQYSVKIAISLYRKFECCHAS